MLFLVFLSVLSALVLKKFFCKLNELFIALK